MPIYEYQCTVCQHQFDVLQKITDQSVKKCPKCGKSTVERLISAAGFQLKGSGWYATDYKNKEKSSQSKENSTSPTESNTSESKVREATVTNKSETE